MRIRRNLIGMTCFAMMALSFSGCGKSHENAENQVFQLETVAVSDEDTEAFATEMKDAENYRGITDASKLQKFYNLDLEDANGSLAQALIRSFPVNEQMQYCKTVNGNLYLFYLKKVGEQYRELVYDTVNGNCGIQIFDEVRSETVTEQGTDNIEREITTYYLVNDRGEQYAGKDARNITASETVNILKKYKGVTDIKEYADWDNPQEILDKYYDEANGMQQDFRYATEDGGTVYLCTVNRMPDGFCLTYYDPAKDWFEVHQFKMLVRLEGKNGYQYYLTNDKDAAFKENSFKNWMEDGFVSIVQ